MATHTQKNLTNACSPTSTYICDVTHSMNCWIFFLQWLKHILNLWYSHLVYKSLRSLCLKCEKFRFRNWVFFLYSSSLFLKFFRVPKLRSLIKLQNKTYECSWNWGYYSRNCTKWCLSWSGLKTPKDHHYLKHLSLVYFWFKGRVRVSCDGGLETCD